MSILGLPRSVGEIYGVLYFAESPLSIDEISSRLKISMGSTSQGLKTLRSLKAIRTSYVQGDRKDYYIAETEFRRLFSNFIKEDILPHLDSATDRISSMEKHVMANPDMNQEFYTTRIEKLKDLPKQVENSTRLAGFKNMNSQNSDEMKLVMRMVLHQAKPRMEMVASSTLLTLDGMEVFLPARSGQRKISFNPSNHFSPGIFCPV